MQVGEKLLFFVILTLFIAGGLGVYSWELSLISLAGGAILILLSLISKRKIYISKSFLFYIAFLALFFFSLVSKRNYEQGLPIFLLYLAGSVYFLLGANLIKAAKRRTDLLFIIPGIAFGILYFWNKFNLPTETGPFSLFLPTAGSFNHIHLGDFWTVPTAISVYRLIKEEGNRLLYSTVSLLGIFFLFVSSSRSSYVALGAGLVYLFYKEGWFKKYKAVLWTLIFLIGTIFFIVSTQKTTIFSRQYFVQGVVGFIDNPWGVGVGNFEEISSNPKYQIYHLESFSENAHNIVLEMATGMGILGFSFVLYLFILFKELGKRKKKENILFETVIIIIFVNFLFDYTYLIPTMIWLWFFVAGLVSERKNSC
jgi:hypothetical protein